MPSFLLAAGERHRWPPACGEPTPAHPGYLRIEIYNGTSNEGWDSVAADRLIWEGFAPWPMGPADQTAYTDTVITDYTGSTKGGSLEELVGLLNILPQNIVIEPDPNRTADFKIILGANYNSCVDRQWVDPASME